VLPCLIAAKRQEDLAQLIDVKFVEHEIQVRQAPPPIHSPTYMSFCLQITRQSFTNLSHTGGRNLDMTMVWHFRCTEPFLLTMCVVVGLHNSFDKHNPLKVEYYLSYIDLLLSRGNYAH
jgi:hypothetical protein